ncbi:FkbM family methyltransferase [Paraburkholderia atlantica]|uniref:FkbM family methyltransferase n=1 Tax=Paraburkholderia atlantica TaxID=2654982 RepID=UPI003D1B128B
MRGSGKNDSDIDFHELAEKVSKIEEALNVALTYLDKNLHVSSNLFETYAHRSSRPYYPLNDGWGLTHLNTGQPFFVNTMDRNITPWIIMGGHWEPNVDRVLMAYAQPGMNVLDIGANMGYYTVKLGTKITSSGSLLAFDPNPEVNAVCLENIKINNLAGHCRIFNYALGDEDATATLTRSNSNMASANLLGEQDADYSVDVEIKVLDNLVPTSRKIDLIKLDAEGYETKILKGAARTLANSKDCATMIELNLRRWEGTHQIEDLIPLCGGNGRTAYAVHDDGTIEEFAIADIRPFLAIRPFSENYFLVAQPHLVKTHLSELLRVK